MATVEELQRLEALLARLAPLARKHRGELIEAQDWNDLVGAVVEVVKAVVDAPDPQGVGVAPHVHTDQVAVGWLDTRLRQLILGGSATDPGARSELARLDRRVGSIVDDLSGLRGRVDEVRGRILDVVTKDLGREADLTRLSRRVEGLDDARLDVTDLRTSLRTLEGDVTRAVEVGQRLERDGQVIDVNALVDRVDGLDALRNALTVPATGRILDVGELERRFAELRTTFVTEAELDEAFEARRPRLSDVDRAAILEESRLAGHEAGTSAVGTVRGELRSELAQRFATIDATVEASVSRATADLQEAILERARTELGERIVGGDEALRAELTTLVGQRADRLARELGERIDRFDANLAERVGVEVSERLPAALVGVERSVAELAGRVASVTDQLGSLDTRLRDTTSRIEVVARDGASERTRLRRELSERIDRVETRLPQQLTDRVTELRDDLRSDLLATIEGGRRGLEARLVEAARQAAATEVRLVANQLRGELRATISDELAANRNELLAAIDTRFDQSANRVAGLVADEVRRATPGFERLVRDHIEALRPELTRLVDRRIGELRPERRNPIVRGAGPAAPDEPPDED